MNKFTADTDTDKLITTPLRVLCGGVVQSTTFLGFFRFHDNFVFNSLYESGYIGDQETSFIFLYHTQ